MEAVHLYEVWIQAIPGAPTRTEYVYAPSEYDASDKAKTNLSDDEYIRGVRQISTPIEQ